MKGFSHLPYLIGSGKDTWPSLGQGDLRSNWLTFLRWFSLALLKELWKRISVHSGCCYIKAWGLELLQPFWNQTISKESGARVCRSSIRKLILSVNFQGCQQQSLLFLTLQVDLSAYYAQHVASGEKVNQCLKPSRRAQGEWQCWCETQSEVTD